MTDGLEGLTAFSGVFQPDAGIPFLDCVNIAEGEYNVQPDFSQYYNHYHCASIPLFSSAQGEMHTLFLGGIAKYYEEDDVLVMDDEVPFVKTIARVTRADDGAMTEYKLPIEMPGYLGSGAEFIKIEDIATYENGVIDLDALSGDSALIGHIYGGIASTERNIFWLNDGTLSEASTTLFEVYLHPGLARGFDALNMQSQSAMRMQLYPNAQAGKLYVGLMMNRPADVLIEVYDLMGRQLENQRFRKGRIVVGENELMLRTPALQLGQAYVVRATAGTDSIAQKMIVND